MKIEKITLMGVQIGYVILERPDNYDPFWVARGQAPSWKIKEIRLFDKFKEKFVK